MPPLADTFGRPHTYLRIALTDRCNLRCTYCMPAGGVDLSPKEVLLSFDEIVRIAGIFARMGVTKIRLTGGEPLVRRDVPRLVERLAALPGIDIVAMTTNGVLLAGYAQVLRDAGLSRLNVSLDTLQPDRFERIALRPLHGEVLAGIEAAIEAGFDPLKVNVVVMKGVNDDELADFVEFARARPVAVRFIEYMPFAANGWDRGRLMTYDEMRKELSRVHELVPLPAPVPSEVAKEFHIEGVRGTVGFITSMTEHFCGDCNRVRLTADGSIKPCLFSSAEMSLRDAVRGGFTDEEIALLIQRALFQKPFQHDPMDRLNPRENRSMIRIGG